MSYTSNQKLALASFFLALAYILPFITGQIPELGSRLLPMHIPILLCGFFCGWKYGLLVGFIAPITRSLFFTMPPLYPVAIAMSFELATFGAITGILYAMLPKKRISVLFALVAAMVIGRFISGIANVILYSLDGKAYSYRIFITGTFINALPGIILQIMIIPIIVLAIENMNDRSRHNEQIT